MRQCKSYQKLRILSQNALAVSHLEDFVVDRQA